MTDARACRPTPGPPRARKIPHSIEIHGEILQDDFFWLREKENPEVLAYLTAENAYADSLLAHTVPLQETLYREMVSRIQQTDLSVPYRQGDYFYYSRTEEGKQYPIHCRKKETLEAEEQVLLDVNEIAQGRPYTAIGVMVVSDDGRWLAFSTDYTGFREYTLRFKDLDSGTVLGTEIEHVTSCAWAADNQTVFYTTEDPAKRPYRLYRHRLGSDRHELIYEEQDERFRVTVARSLSKAFLFLNINSHTTSEVRYLRSDCATGEWRLLAPREPEHEYEVAHHSNFFYIRTNSGGRHFRLVRAPVADSRKENWEEVLPHRPEVMLEGMEFFANHYVLFEREQGLPQFRVTDLRTGQSQRIFFPEAVYTAAPAENREFASTRFRYTYSSFITPPCVLDYDMEKHESELLKQTQVLGGYDPSRYESERIYATSPDGTAVPVSLVRLKGVQRDGKAPLLLAGYGAYGISLDVGFNSNRFSLIDRGVTFAIAHVRGGGELCRAWHDAGRMLNKKNTFTDFISVAEHLIAEKYTAADRLVITGGSAGGLLMGAVVNQRPELFKTVVMLVPFLDVLNSMLDESLPLTVGEFEEWGNPKIKEHFDYIRSYCPYSNLAPQRYPAMLLRTSFNDSQVMYWEPAKYVAKLRTQKQDGNVLLLKTNLAAGHGGASGRYDKLREIALDYAFVLDQLGIHE